MQETKQQKIEEILTRGVEKIYPNKKSLEDILLGSKKLRIYNGIDPTGKLHIGHLVVFRKLRQLQALGHEIIILMGDFTATIGDPTDKKATRKPLTREQVLENTKGYEKQIGKVLDVSKKGVRFMRNGEWINKLKPADMLKLASQFTVARLLERDMFQKRIKEGRDIHVHEFLYPIFQAYDSVAMDVDMEVGGNDQTFNMLAGRDLIKKIKNKEKFVLTLKLLTDPSGKKMGKTEGNMVNLDEDPGQMFGKIMSWPDGIIIIGLEILTDIPMEDIKKYEKEMQQDKANPRDIKALLAKEIITTFYNKEAAEKAEEEFGKIFRDKAMPSEIEGVGGLALGNFSTTATVVDLGLADSKSEAKRLIIQGGLKIDGQVEKDWKKIIERKRGQIYQAGKRKFKKII